MLILITFISALIDAMFILDVYKTPLQCCLHFNFILALLKPIREWKIVVFDTVDRDVDCGAMYKVMMGCVMLVGFLCM